LQDFEGLNPFATVDSKETKPCLGLIECSPGQRFFAKELWAQSIKEVLRRPSEPAEETGNLKNAIPRYRGKQALHKNL
jgi:hypothetical protein